MQTLVGISFLLLISASLVVGVRLLRLWQRTRELPELFLGLMLILQIGVGYPLQVAARAGESIGFSAAWASLVAGMVLTNLGLWMLYLFTWKTFRADSRLVRWFVFAVGATFILNAFGIAGHTWSRGSTITNIREIPVWLACTSFFCTTVAYVWATLESLRFHAVLRRRLALGLSERLVTNRVLLWGQMTGVAGAIVLLNNVASFMRIDVLSSTSILAFTSIGGLSQAVYLVLIFLPPRAYRAWVEGQPTMESA